MTSYSDLPILTVTGKDGIVYAYQDTGGAGLPLVCLNHFRGNLDNWDPALVDALRGGGRVLTFDYVGVAGSSGVTQHSVAEMALGTLTFIDALGLDRVDLLGFSIGSFAAQEIVLTRPDLVNRVVLASSAPQGAEGMHGWAREVMAAVGIPEVSPEGFLDVFFAKTASSRSAGQAAAGRIYGPRPHPDVPTSWDTRLAQYDAVCAWGVPNHALLQRVTTIDKAVFIANGDSDPMILPRYSYLLAGLIPDSQLKIYPDAAHGFLFQHHEEFAADVRAFLQQRSSVSVP
jgi:pimeloyl-ACP methyl ester carboxylesterase